MRQQSEIHILCDTCLHRRRCRKVFALHFKAFKAWSNDAPSVDCEDYRLRTYRGLEGVVDCSPRPSLVGNQDEVCHAQH